MKIRLARNHGLLLTSVTVTYRGVARDIPDVLIDTGSAGIIFATDALSDLGVSFESNDLVCGIRGVGGREYVFRRRVDRLAIAGHGVKDFDVEVGGMDYGFPLNGILGLDFLTSAAAILDLGQLTLEFPGIT